MTRLGRILGGLVVATVAIVATVGAIAASAAASETTPGPPAAWPPHYGNAPEEMVPYRRATPYVRFFTEQQPFLGPGRDDPAPEGLKSLKIGVLASSS